MRHPFDGVNGLTRRSALGTMVGAVAGLVGTAQAQVQIQIQATTKALGEEGGVATTQAIGEEGGPATRAIGEDGGAVAQGPTTEPFGEEAGRVTSKQVPGLEDGGMAATKARGENGGGVVTQAIGENGGPAVTTLALGEEGGVTRARGEDGGRVVPVKPASTEIKKDALETAWKDLAAKDSARGVQGCAVIYGAKEGVEFLKGNLVADKFKVAKADSETVEKLIKDLDAESFKAREKAEAELSTLGAAAEAAMAKAVKDPRSTEQRMRLERLLEKVRENSPLTQGRRGLEVLVALNTPEAKAVVEKLSKGDDKEWLTQAAREALSRMK